MNFFYNILVLFTLLISAGDAPAMGFGDWSEYTRNGTQFMDNGGGPTIFFGDYKPLERVRKWYFYQDHIVGVFERDKVKAYFVINELNGTVAKFREEETWQAYINAYDLKPLLWTRWYSDNWNHMRALTFLLLFGFPFTIGWLLLHIRWIREAKKKGARKYFVYLSMLPFLLLTTYLFSQFPGSI